MAQTFSNCTTESLGKEGRRPKRHRHFARILEQSTNGCGRTRLDDCLPSNVRSAIIAANSLASFREFIDMKLNRKTAALVLVKGQVWKLQDTHIEILEMGKRLASYKHFPLPDNRLAP